MLLLLLSLRILSLSSIRFHLPSFNAFHILVPSRFSTPRPHPNNFLIPAKIANKFRSLLRRLQIKLELLFFMWHINFLFASKYPSSSRGARISCQYNSKFFNKKKLCWEFMKHLYCERILSNITPYIFSTKYIWVEYASKMQRVIRDSLI